MSEAIAVLSQKGGTGKTTMVRSLADIFERLEIDVLAVDADPQGNLSDYFDTEPSVNPTLGEVLQGQARAADRFARAPCATQRPREWTRRRR